MVHLKFSTVFKADGSKLAVGYSEFYKETQTGRKSINLDLAWYPPQEAGTFRIVKPFLNGATKKAYETYYEFKLVDKEPSRQPIKGKLTLEKNTYEPNPDTLTIKYLYINDSTLSSSIILQI